MTRLDKCLGDNGFGTRKELKEIIRKGRVSVNGKTVTSPEFKVNTESDAIAMDGRVLDISDKHYFMIYKPEGVITATEDRKQSTVLDILPEEIKGMSLFPVGRLDKDTSGLLLLTDDGNFAHKVISPGSRIEKVYIAEVEGKATQADIKAFEEGIILRDGTRCLPAKLVIQEDGSCRVTVYEGKYHQVRRMLASRQLAVKTLKRISIGSLTLDEDMAPGDCRSLTKNDLCKVYARDS